MVSQNTICGEIEWPNKDWEFPEIVIEVQWASNKGKEQDKDQSYEGITENEQAGKNVNKVREAYFNFIQHRERKWLIPREWQRREL